jgi:serine/threonine protein kinase
MNPPSPPGHDEFLVVASRQAMISEDATRELSREAVQRGVTTSQLVLEKGLMDPVQIEIVETLLRPDQIVPGYEIIDLLGRGAMGVVYRARQKNLDRVVALKTVLVSQATQPGLLARFEKEAQTVGQLRHPNIVAAYDFGRHQGRLYFAMELVEGEELGKLIDRNGRLGERLAWGLARQIASGLSQAARAGVVHRDVKPANILLIEPPEGFALPDGLPMVKITDFGLALLSRDAETGDRLTMAGSTLGTPRYMAPEQLEGSDVDHRADIYALGATVYHMLTGRAPFGEKTLSAVITRKLGGEPPRVSEQVPDASRGTVDLVAKMMARKPADRIPDYPTLLARIDRLTASLPLDEGVDSLAETRELTAADGSTAASVAPNRRIRDRRSDGHRADSLEATSVAPAVSTIVSLPVIARSRRNWLWGVGAAGVAAIAVGGYFGGQALWGTRPLLAEPTLEPGEWSRYLYDGQSLRGWQIVDGQWSRGQDDEGGRVLTGRGCIGCSLERLPPLLDYRLTLAVSPQSADAVELQFAMRPEAGGDAPRYVLRWTAGEVLVGERASNRGAFTVLAPAVPVAIDDPDDGLVYHELRVERHATHWRAFFDGNRVALLPLPRQPERPEFQLLTEGGPAWFDAVQVMELVAAPHVE